MAVADPRKAPTRERGVASANVSWWGVAEGEETPELRWPHSVEVYDRMRRQDAQVISVLRAVTLPIRRTPWRIEPNGAPDEVVAFVAANLNLPVLGVEEKSIGRGRDRFSWGEHLRLALLQLTFGHAFFEPVYRIGDDGRAWIRKLGYRPPRTIQAVNVASDGGLVSIEQITPQSSAVIPVNRLVAYVNDREGGNWLGQSLLRPAYKFWMLKDRLLRVQAQTVDRNGLGVPVYTASEPVGRGTPEQVEAAQKQELKAGLALAQGYRSGEASGAALPHGAELELKGVSGSLPDAMAPIRYYDEQIARAVLAHFLNLGTETGSWALGSTFADFFTLSLQTVGLAVADVATQHIVEDLVDLNFGVDVGAPRVVFDEIGARHPATAAAVQQLVTCGAITPDEVLEQHLRTQFGLPAAKKNSSRPGVIPAGEPTGPRGSEQEEVVRWPGS